MFHLVRNLFARNPKSATRSRRSPRRRTNGHLSLERLEQRLAPAVYRVTTAGDDVVVAPTGGAGTAADPFLMNTLRGAILASNATVGVADEITFDASLNSTPITLTLAGEDNTALLGDLDINDDLTITGNGSANTIIQAGTDATNGIDKVFGINPIGQPDIDVSLTGITVRFGRNTTNPSEGNQDDGGGIDFVGAGTGANSSSLSITNSVITQNSTRFDTETTGHTGGGLSIREVTGVASTGVVTIVNSTISNNTSAGAGGGIAINGFNLQVSILSSAITDNSTLTNAGTSEDGGGISVIAGSDLAPTGAFLIIDDSVIQQNTAGGGGGGVAISSNGAHTFVVTSTAFRGNQALGDGASISGQGGGLFSSLVTGASATLTNVTLSSNFAVNGAAANGGGLYNAAGVVVVQNSTITGSLAHVDGGGLFNAAAGVTTLRNVTIAINHADSNDNASGTGGGIRNVAGGTVTLENTIVAENFSSGIFGTDDDINGTVTANFSLIGDTTGATIVGSNNLLNVNAGVNGVADNGGPTVGPTGSTVVLQTMALNSDSPALDAGSNVLIPPAITTDQRGVPFARIRDAAADANLTDTVDMGAFEAQISIENVADQIMDEDTSLVLNFRVADIDIPFDSVTAVSANVSLVPNLPANISVSGTGSTRTLTITPLPNAFGILPIGLTVNATINGSVQSMLDIFVLTINPLADVPTVTSGVTLPGVQTPVLPITPNAIDGASVTHFKITNITNGTLFKSNGTTQINSGDFITLAEAAAGARFTPLAGLVSAMADFHFDVQAALGITNFGLSAAVTAQVAVSPLAGTWFINGQSTYILQDGNTLTFINERDENAAGVVVDADSVTATGWGNLGGELSFNTITWANGTVWTRSDTPPSPVIPSDFRFLGQHAHVEQKGPELFVTNERGEVSRSRFISSTQIVATEWNDLLGTLVNGNTQINWANGTTWTAPPVEAAADVSGIYTFNGLFAHIKQDGFALTLVNERGETTAGTLSPDGTTINVASWPVIGNVAGGNINWSNGTAWVKTAFPLPVLSHVWTIGGRPTQLDFNNGELFLTNEFGNLSRAVFLSANQILAVNWGLLGTLVNGNTQINWANGTTWTASPSLVDTFFANDPNPFD